MNRWNKTADLEMVELTGQLFLSVKIYWKTMNKCVPNLQAMNKWPNFEITETIGQRMVLQHPPDFNYLIIIEVIDSGNISHFYNQICVTCEREEN